MLENTCSQVLSSLSESYKAYKYTSTENICVLKSVESTTSYFNFKTLFNICLLVLLFQCYLDSVIQCFVYLVRKMEETKFDIPTQKYYI